MKKERALRPSTKGTRQAAELITKHVYASKEGLIKAAPVYRRGLVWRSKANRSVG